MGDGRKLTLRAAKMQGSTTVDVEWRDSEEDFGQGKKKKMRFGEFMQRLQAGDQSLYLTTQSVRPCHCRECSLCMHMDSVQAFTGRA